MPPSLGGASAAGPGRGREAVGWLIADLDSEDYATREKAGQELERLRARRGPPCGRPWRNPLVAGSSSPSGRFAGPPPRVLPRTARRGARVEVLERIGTSEARQVLESLAKEGRTPGWSRKRRRPWSGWPAIVCRNRRRIQNNLRHYKKRVDSFPDSQSVSFIDVICLFPCLFPRPQVVHTSPRLLFGARV